MFEIFMILTRATVALNILQFTISNRESVYCEKERNATDYVDKNQSPQITVRALGSAKH